MALRHEYVDYPETPWSGMQEMKKMIDRTVISNKLKEMGLPSGISNITIDPISIIERFGVSGWIGCFRHTAVVKVDEVLRNILGWKRVPAGATFSRFFKKFTLAVNHQLFIDLHS